MTGVLVAARVVLMVVFAVAGVAKLVDRRGSAEAVSAFGAPAWVAPWVAVGLPLLELGIAAGLIAHGSEVWAALVASVLLVSFAVAIGIALANGRRPACHCFGELSAGPASAWTLARTCALATLASGLFVASLVRWPLNAPDLLARLSPLDVAVLVGCVAVAVVLGFGAWFMSELLRQNGRLLRRLEAVEAELGLASGAAPHPTSPLTPPIGAPAPRFRALTATGGEASLVGLLGRGLSTVLVFTDPHCGPCKALLPDVGVMQRRYAGLLTVAVVANGSVEDARAVDPEGRVDDLLVVTDGAIARSYGAVATPSALLIERDGSIASPLARGSRAVRVLIEQSAQQIDVRSPEQRESLLAIGHHPAVETGGVRGR